MAPVSEELLKAARSAGARLAEAERAVQVARADYHAMVRRLHLAGASLREVAEALRLSHQRVQQIVDVAGGTWWRRVWRSRNKTADLACTWCGRPSEEVSKLIAGPNVYICDSCTEAAEQSLKTEGSVLLRRAKAREKSRCSFCHKRSSEKRALVVGRTANICAECLRMCREILDASPSSLSSG
jgi:ClpX C4-type zinc finger